MILNCSNRQKDGTGASDPFSLIFFHFRPPSLPGNLPVRPNFTYQSFWTKLTYNVKGSPTSFMSHSPLALMHDQQTLAAHLHNMSQFNGGSMLNPRTPATSHMNTLQSHFQSLANGKLSPNDIHERHTPQSDENSAGSGSVGAGPRINGHIEVKLEEVSVRVKFSLGGLKPSKDNETSFELK